MWPDQLSELTPNPHCVAIHKNHKRVPLATTNGKMSKTKLKFEILELSEKKAPAPRLLVGVLKYPQLQSHQSETQQSWRKRSGEEAIEWRDWRVQL